MDKLNTHSIGSLYEAFGPEKALRLAKRLEIHYTPKHGSWLNIAEIELNVMTLQCTNFPCAVLHQFAYCRRIRRSAPAFYLRSTPLLDGFPPERFFNPDTPFTVHLFAVLAGSA